MDISLKKQFINSDVFNGLSSDTREKLCQNLTLIRFDLGSTIIEDETIPGNILFHPRHHLL